MDTWINQPGSLEVGRDLPSAGAIAKFVGEKLDAKQYSMEASRNLKV